MFGSCICVRMMILIVRDISILVMIDRKNIIGLSYGCFVSRIIIRMNMFSFSS